MSCATVFGGTGFVGRRVVRQLRDYSTRVRTVSRHRKLGEDAGIEQIAADARDQRSVEAAVAGAGGVVNAISLYVEHGGDTFHSVHVETAAKIARAARQAGIRRFVHVSGIGANTASSSPYIRSRGEGEAAVQTAFPGAVIVRPAVMFASDDAFLTTILRLLRSSRSTLTMWLWRSHKFCGKARNRFLSTNWLGRASTLMRSYCEPLLESQDCGRC
jgi:uncharacterized protein YbjT (DUF2867 family)